MQGFQDASGPPNLAQLQATMQAIELACSSIQMHINPSAAEATILSLRQSPHPYQTCQFILENSQVANAQFQAAAAIRDAAIREWSFLTADVKRTLISFCLCHLMQHASSPERYVQAKVSAVAAQLMKRGWLDFEVSEKEPFFSQINQSIHGVHGVDVQFCGVNFLESLVSEFSPSTSSAMGLPREFHEQCRRSLELNYLKTFYCWAKDAAVSVTNVIIDSQTEVPEVKVCTAALRLMFQILNWDFYNTVGAKASVSFYFAGVKDHGDTTKRSEYNLVQPGPAWHDVLISSGHISWLLNLYAALRQKFSCQAFWLDCPIAISARKLIVQFCSLAGTIFHSDNGQMHENHLLQLLLGIIQWIDPPDAVSRAIESGKCESEMLDGCRALLSIATVTTPFVFDQLLKSIRPFGTLQLLSSLMGEVVKVLMTHNSDEETWSWQARDVLLDSWTALLIPLERCGQSSLLPHEGISAAANLFGLIVESELKAAASASAFDDNIESEYFQASVSAMDERLSAYALIARAAINVTVPFLIGLFSELLSKLNQGRGIIDPTETLEEIYSLLLIIGHVLADEVEGETPLVPNAIQSRFTDVMEADKHPVVVLSSLIIRFCEQCLDLQTRSAIFSPRLMESVVWFLSRWSSTYLLHPEETITTNCNYGKEHDNEFQSQHTRKVIYSFFGEHGQGIPILDIVIRISATTLLSYPGEKDLHALTCNQLLRALVRQKHICKHLVALDSWRNLINAFDNDKKLFLLDSAHQRSLAQTLVRSASGVRNIESSNQYVRDIMGHTGTHLVEMASRKDLTSIAQQPDVMMMISCLLERLRGAACALEPRTQRSIYELGFSVMNPVLVLLAVYKDESAVVYMLLKFVVHWVDGQINYLEAQETATVVDFCMRLLQLYSSHNIGKISLSLSSSLLNEAKNEKYKDLRALLQLLSNLCSKDLVDFSSDSSDVPATDISQVVYFGLHILSPLISLDLLKYPKLCRDYFSLLSHLLEVYPETVAKLNHEAFAQVLGTLDFGLHHQDTEVVDMCLKALKSLASYHLKEIAAGNIGLGSQVITRKDVSEGEAVQEGVLSGFLKSLLQLLLFEDYSPDLVGNAADALFPLILCDQVLYQKLATELIERQDNPTFKSRIVNAIHTLTSANQLSSVLDRINSQRFRKNLHNFLIEVRGFLRTV